MTALFDVWLPCKHWDNMATLSDVWLPCEHLYLQHNHRLRVACYIIRAEIGNISCANRWSRSPFSRSLSVLQTGSFGSVTIIDRLQITQAGRRFVSWNFQNENVLIVLMSEDIRQQQTKATVTKISTILKLISPGGPIRNSTVSVARKWCSFAMTSLPIQQVSFYIGAYGTMPIRDLFQGIVLVHTVLFRGIRPIEWYFLSV